jgi:hypothetical protein
MEETRSCTHCNEIKPLPEYYFIKHENRYNRKCKLCINNHSKSNYGKSKVSSKIQIIEKTCITCNTLKSIDSYYKQLKQKDGYSNVCIYCHKEYHTGYRKKSSLKYLNPLPENHKKCNHCDQILPFPEYNKIRKNQPQLNPYCKSCSTIKHKEWVEKNGREWGRNYVNNKRKTDPQFKIKQLLRGRYLDALKRHTSGGKVNKSHSAIDLIGCTIDEYVEYLENLFYPEMTWENHGTVWEIDHIKPCDAFNLIDPDEQKTCFHYSNTTPLFKTTEIAISLGYNNILGNRNKNNIF